MLLQEKKVVLVKHTRRGQYNIERTISTVSSIVTEGVRDHSRCAHIKCISRLMSWRGRDRTRVVGGCRFWPWDRNGRYSGWRDLKNDVFWTPIDHWPYSITTSFHRKPKGSRKIWNRWRQEHIREMNVNMDYIYTYKYNKNTYTHTRHLKYNCTRQYRI